MPRRSLGPLVRPAMYYAPSSRASGCDEKLLLYTRTCTPRSSSFRILMTEYVPSSFGVEYSPPSMRASGGWDVHAPTTSRPAGRTLTFPGPSDGCRRVVVTKLHPAGRDAGDAGDTNAGRQQERSEDGVHGNPLGKIRPGESTAETTTSRVQPASHG